MKPYAVLTDSTCDLPQEMADSHGIDIINFKIAVDGNGYTERVDFSPEQFCEMLRNAKSVPTTAQITSFEFLDRFEEYDRRGVKDVLYVSINATGSGTHAQAHQAAKQFKNEHPESGMRIFIVDSHAYSIAQGYPVIEAAEMLDLGRSMEEVVSFLEDKYARMEILLVAYTLKVIRKSGRVSAAAAIAGELLGIHPIFTLNDGVSRVIRKIRGEKAAATVMAQTMKSRMVPGKPYFVMVTDKRYMDEYKKVCEQVIGYPPAGIHILGAAVQSNTGPEAVGMVYEGAKRERD